MFEKFRIFCGCYSENFEFLERDEGVFYPKVKTESKNTSIEAGKSRAKNAIFWGRVPSSKIASIITSRNRHGFAPALEDLHGRGGRYDPPILRCARLDRAQSGAVEVRGVPQAVLPGLLLYC